MSRVVGPFLAAVLLSSTCWAQAPAFPGLAQPPRDNATLPTGTAMIRGHVYDASNGQPLRKAQVRATSPELRENRLAITDNNGAYEIKSLAAGRYQLGASKGSFVQLQYGQTRPFEQGKPIELLNAQQLDRVDFRLPHGAVVTGRVVDEVGEPASDAQVTIMRNQYINGRRQLSVARLSQTNDIGEFRLFAIPPGQYVISASMRGLNFGDSPADDRSGYAPTYYPNTTSPTEAQRVTLTVGQMMTDINITLSPTRLARVSGTAVDSNGKAISGGTIMMIQNTGSFFMTTSGGQIKPDGSFSIGGLTPGEYQVRAMPLASGPINLSNVEQIQASFTVTGDDINDLRLVGTKPSTMTGKVIPPAGSQADMRELMLLSLPKNPMPLGGNTSTRVNEDGTFTLPVQPGSAYLRLNPQGAFATTRIKAVRLNGVEVTDTGFEFKPNEDVSGVEIELTAQMASVSGTVSDARGNPVRDYTVLLFPRDKERWESTSRYLFTARPDQEGKYKASYVLPGTYYAIALDYVEQGAQTDPDFLERIRDRAIELTINDIETKNLDLKLVPTP
jgi:protocatechuate 3,4-dioxygenase beta subunit